MSDSFQIGNGNSTSASNYTKEVQSSTAGRTYTAHARILFSHNLKTMLETIQRHFPVTRGELEMCYSFTTFPFILGDLDRYYQDSPVLWALCTYLRDVFINGKPEGERASISGLSPLMVQSKQEKNEDIVGACLRSNYRGRGKYQHETVQKYFLEFVGGTIAYEVPVWDDESIGHIDLVRIRRVANAETVEVLDFKPDAKKEKNASSQVYRYAKILEKNLKMLLTHSANKSIVQVHAGYFDDRHYYSVSL